MKRFNDKVALVTGAGSGIGRAVAVRLAAEGAAVFCVDVSAEHLAATQALITQAGGRALTHVCDVSNEDAVRACVQACIDALGRLDRRIARIENRRRQDEQQKKNA